MAEKQLDSFALDWIKLRSLTLAKSINKTTTEALLKELITGRELGETISQLSKRIEGYFTENAKTRAAMISRTETIAANAEGTLRRFEIDGVDKSEFYPAPSACEECLGYVGIYPTKETHGIIPVHPNCKCQWLGVVE